MDPKTHWEKVYSTQAPDKVSWYAPHLAVSMDLIQRAAGVREAAIIDIGGGESTLADDLLSWGFTNLTVLDVSRVAIEATQARLGGRSQQVHWMAADITRVELPAAAYDVWHDRAVFHFLTDPNHRAAYVRQAARAVKHGGHLIVSTFGPEGPARCSGLTVERYDADSLHGVFGPRFRLVESSTQLHQTPAGATQQFLYCYCVVE
ncbi:MAG: class I SAM-dependent methyltransferase [Terriglobales bacterium]